MNAMLASPGGVRGAKYQTLQPKGHPLDETLTRICDIFSGTFTTQVVARLFLITALLVLIQLEHKQMMMTLHQCIKADSGRQRTETE